MNQVQIRIDGSQVTQALSAKFMQAVNPKADLFREVALDLMAMIHERIHVDGKAANGSQIGTYSTEYMKVRTGNFGNSQKFSKGKKQGANKNAGTTTKGKAKGSPRPNYHRSGDTKVILSLTRQMENDYAVVGTETGWGIGFNNELNADKARYNDKRYGKTVYALTEDELAYAVKKTETLVAQQLSKP